MCMYVGEHVCRPSLLCNPVVVDKIDNYKPSTNNNNNNNHSCWQCQGQIQDFPSGGLSIEVINITLKSCLMQDLEQI